MSSVLDGVGMALKTIAQSLGLGPVGTWAMQQTQTIAKKRNITLPQPYQGALDWLTSKGLDINNALKIVILVGIAIVLLILLTWLVGKWIYILKSVKFI